MKLRDTHIVLLFVVLYALLLAMTTVNPERITGDAGNHAVAGVLVKDVAGFWAANPGSSPSELAETAIEHHMHYKSFASFITHTPFHFLFLGLIYMIFGVSRFAAIIPAIIESMITLFFVYRLCMLGYRNRSTAFLAMILLAFSPLFFFFSTYVMLEMPSTMFLVITVYYFSLYMMKEKNRHLYLACAGAALAILAKPPMALILPVLFLVMIWEKKLTPSWLLKNFKYLALSAVIFLVVLSPWLIGTKLLQDRGIDLIGKWAYHAGGSDTSPDRGFSFMDGTVREGITSSPPKNFLFYVSTLFFTWYLVPFYIMALFLGIFRKRSSLNVVEKHCLLIAIIFLSVFSVFAGNQPRFLIYTLPFFIIPASRVITRYFGTMKNPVVLIIVILAVAQSIHFLYVNEAALPVGDFDTVSAYIINDSPGRTTVVTTLPRAQIFSLSILDTERKIYALYMVGEKGALGEILDGTYSEPEWESLGLEYPPAGYVVVHEGHEKMKGDGTDITELLDGRNDFEMVETVPGKTPGTKTFIYRRKA